MFTTTEKRAMTDEQMVHLVRNALFVAGKEMGDKGDHWPVINDTIQHVMQDWEKWQIENAVHEELKKHLYAHLENMERLLPTCTPEEQAFAAPKLKELREIYDAYFTDVDENVLYPEDAALPMYVKRAETIINTLEFEDA